MLPLRTERNAFIIASSPSPILSARTKRPAAFGSKHASRTEARRARRTNGSRARLRGRNFGKPSPPVRTFRSSREPLVGWAYENGRSAAIRSRLAVCGVLSVTDTHADVTGLSLVQSDWNYTNAFRGKGDSRSFSPHPLFL